MPEHLRSAVAGTTALLVCAVSSVNAYASAPLLRAHARLQALPVRAARRVAPVGPSMVHTPSRIDENDAVAVANLKRSLDRLVELPSAEPSDHVMMRSPCTSLYGSCRPTTGTDSIQSSTRQVKLGRKSKDFMEPPPQEKSKTRGRPSVVIKSAVREELRREFITNAALVLEQNGGCMDSNLFGQHWKHAHPDAPIHAYKTTKGVTIHQMLRENERFFQVSDTTRHKVKFFQLVPGEVESYLSESKKESTVESSLVASMAESVRSAVDNIDVAILEEEKAPVLAMNFEAEQLELEDLYVETESMLAPMAPADESRDPVVHHQVPGQGKARRASGFDRRLQAPARRTKESRSFDAYREEMPQAPTADERDAIKHPVVSLYNAWAMDGRDVVMEVTHGAAFEEIWEHVVEEKLHPKRTFTAIDAGCGNGWASRRIAQHPQCQSVVGVDASAVMVDRAQALSSEHASADKVSFSVGDVAKWAPEEEVDMVNMCETLYMLQEPQAALNNIVPKWLKPGGLFVASLDCYWENKLSHAWENDLGVPMHCLSESEWVEMFEKAGLTNVQRWRSKQSGPWQGTLLMTGERKA
jgi:SAM-dependent methyltransferase